MADVRETDLPGIGTQFDFTTSSGDPVAVLIHRSGRREIMVYDRVDPDRCHTALRLSPDDALTLVEVLGTSRVIARLAAAQHEVAGLTIDWIVVAPTSPWVGRNLADAAIHTRIGVSIVAIGRGDETIDAPGATTELQAGDRVIAVGTAEGVAQLERELGGV